MSHTLKNKTAVTDAGCLARACARLGLAAPEAGLRRLYDSTKVEGLAVKLPGWTYDVVFDLATGTATYDNFNGHWGKAEHLESLLQAYALEATIAAAQAEGLEFTLGLTAKGEPVVRILHPGEDRYVEATIHADATATVAAHGFEGNACQLATARVAAAIGRTEAEAPHPEMFNDQRETLLETESY
jgi:hypothetical protein